MATRSVWSGHLSFGLVSIPIKLYVAAREERIDLHMLCESCNSGVKQRYVCEACGKEVPRTGGSRFYAWDKVTKIILKEFELDRLDPATSKVSTVLEFVKLSDVDPVHFASSFYVAPGEGGDHAFSLLLWAMQEMDVLAVAKITMTQREHLVVFRPSAGRLMLHQLFYEDEVRIPDRVPDLSGERLSEPEKNLARMLVDSMAAKFDISQYQDQRRINLIRLIEAKHAGIELESSVAKMPPRSTVDLLATLKASLAERASVEEKRA